jgi:hypothetical protein
MGTSGGRKRQEEQEQEQEQEQMEQTSITRAASREMAAMLKTGSRRKEKISNAQAVAAETKLSRQTVPLRKMLLILLLSVAPLMQVMPPVANHIIEDKSRILILT